jgi:uncharacterized protein involved in exopolysaccharide biosynthesis
MEPFISSAESRADQQGMGTRIIEVLFRHVALMSLAFAGVVGGAVAAAYLQPARYESSLEILVNRDRVSPIITPEATSVPQLAAQVTEEELNSEAELLKDHDLLKQIVLQCGLHYVGTTDRLHGLTTLLSTPRVDAKDRQQAATLDRPVLSSGSTSFGAREPVAFLTLRTHAGELQPTISEPENSQLERAVRKLDRTLAVGVIKKTNLISLRYESTSREQAADVLNRLAALYLDKHIAVHRPVGRLEFFQQEDEHYRQELAHAQAALIGYGVAAGVVSAQLEKDSSLQRQFEFAAMLKQVQAAIAETQQRIVVLQQQIATGDPRMVTQVRDADDGVLMSQLKTSLLGLEQKRTELLTKFEPGYRAVGEVDEQIRKVNTAISAVTKLHEQTTDRDPTYEWAREEVAKAQTDLGGLEQRARSLRATIESYRLRASLLAEQENTQNNLIFNMKSAQDNLLLSTRKEEEVRLSDALDRGRILNVSIAQAAFIPSLPSNHRARIVAFGLVAGLLLSIGLAFAVDYLDNTVQSAEQVSALLNRPVLAVISRGV